MINGLRMIDLQKMKAFPISCFSEELFSEELFSEELSHLLLL